jgi:hypothetical protein
MNARLIAQTFGDIGGTPELSLDRWTGGLVRGTEKL